MSKEDLQPCRTKEEAKKRGKAGGIASGEARRKRKTLREELAALLEIGDTQNRLSTAIIDKAIKGDVKAFETIRDTIGEKPTDKQEIEYGENTLAAVTAGMSLDDKQAEIDKLMAEFKPEGSE